MSDDDLEQIKAKKLAEMMKKQQELNNLYETGVMEGALGYRIAEQLKNFLGHFLESRGVHARIEKIDY